MDEWIALLAQKINPESTQHILTQIYVMLLASHPWLRFSGEHRWFITEMAMAIGEIEALRSIKKHRNRRYTEKDHDKKKHIFRHVYMGV